MRLYSIMNDLKEKENYCSIEYFIQKYKVSKRTIQNDISYLMRISPRNGYQIQTKRGQGYLLEITNEELYKDFVESLNEGMSFHTKERPGLMLAYLTIRETYVSMEQIAEFFQISKTLVKNDMQDVEELARQYHMDIERRSHYGVRIVCKDKYLKKYLVSEYLNQNVIVQTAINDVVKDFNDIETQVVNQLNNYGLNINYNELINVIEYLKVIVFVADLKKERHQDFKHHDDVLERITEFIIHLLEKRYQVFFNLDTGECLLEVLNKNVRKNISNISFTDYLADDIEDFLKNIDQTYDTSFQLDQDFKKLLEVHVSLLVDRLHNKISYKNPLANELSITYPMIFNIAIQFCDMLNEKYGVKATFDEIGFIATHFAAHMEKEKQKKLQSYNKIGVVCSSGGGSAYMIKMQIESLFPNAQVCTFSFLQQDELLKFEPDLIFTVMPLSSDIQIPIIYIKELLDDRDLYRIKQILQCDEYDPYILINEDPVYYSFFSKDFFKITEGHDYIEMITEMANELEEEKYGKDGYCQLVLERETFVSTIYMNGVCIPHPLETDALKNMISVRVLKKPFFYNNKEVKIIFMICLKKDQIEIYKMITKKLYQLMKEPNYLEKIVNVKSFEEMMAIMKEMGGVNHE